MQEPVPVGRSKRFWRSVSGNTNRSRERDSEGMGIQESNMLGYLESGVPSQGLESNQSSRVMD
jgi:hypothetical protein